MAGNRGLAFVEGNVLMNLPACADNAPVSIMEVCGTHTMAVAKYGIRQLLPDAIKLISGPGCPVCVTPTEDIDKIIELAGAGVCIATFGDLMRVPGNRSTLSEERARGRDIRVVYSPLDALEIAAGSPERQVVFIGIGFETTAPGVALSIIHARSRGIKNYSVLCLHKTMPRALRSLLDGGAGIDGFLLPGHVCAVTGIKPFEFLARDYGIPGVVSGFEAKDIVESIGMIMSRLHSPAVDIQYRRAVKPGGNPEARKVMEEVFEASGAVWRGLGFIENSGLCIKKDWSEYDAKKRWKGRGNSLFPAKPGQVESGERPGETRENRKCKCGQVLRGAMEPFECPLFAKACTPDHPVGPCMVSSEGSCAAYFKYENRDVKIMK